MERNTAGDGELIHQL